MKLIFAGTPEFARTALERLIHAGHDVALVLTQPDRPAGRGMKLHASPVKQCALQHGIALAQPRSLRLDGTFAEDAAAARAALCAASADAIVVAAYGLILPQWVLDLPPLGCLNIHASLLPRWRGAAPIHRAIEAGDTHTGICIMHMDAGLDTGDVLLHHSMAIAAHDTTATLHDRLALLGADLIVQALHQAQAGSLQPQPQPAHGVTYAHKIDKSESLVDWSAPAQVIARRIRAFNPFPAASTYIQGESVKLWEGQVGCYQIDSCQRMPQAVCGQIVFVHDAGIGVACADSEILTLTQLQRAGGKRLSAADFVRGFALRPGMVLGR